MRVAEDTIKLTDTPLRRLAPTLLAGLLAAIYVLVSPPSLDLAAHLLRAKLFASEGFGLWSNWWYGGHHTPGYSVLFPPLAAAFTPQLVAAVAATASAALFDRLARAHFGRDAFLGSLWFAAGTATELYTGRLAFAFGMLPALAMALALHRRRDGVAALLAAIAALASPVAALFAAMAAAACAAGRYAEQRRLTDAVAPLAVAAAALLPVLVLSVLFPEGGSEPFARAALWPIPVIAGAALLTLPREQVTLRAAVVLYLVGCLAAYAVISPIGGNASRLAPLIAGPLAALIFWPRRKLLLALIALPLLYYQWQAPVRDVRVSAGDPSAVAGYYRPLLAFLEHAGGPPFRVEIPFTQFHREAYEVAPRFPLARGWERQLDIKDNHLFYGGRLDATTYHEWLRALAIRYVAVSTGPADYSAHAEINLIERGLPYLKLVMSSRDWRVYELLDPTALADGVASATAIGPNSVTLRVRNPGEALVRVRFTPYWKLSGVSGCVAPAGDFTRLSLRRSGVARLVIGFALTRVGASSPRCS